MSNNPFMRPYGAPGGMQSAQVGQPQYQATLQPTTFQSESYRNAEYYADQVYYPTPLFPALPGLVPIPRTRTRTVTVPAAGTTAQLQWIFDIPTNVYALTGACIEIGAGPAVTERGLNTFRIQFGVNTNDFYDADSALGSNLLGTAENPRLLGGRAWKFDGHTTLFANITTLIDDLTIDVTVWGVELRGPRS